MKQTRRKFIKNSLITSAAAFFAPGLFINSDVHAETKYKLNYKPEPHDWKDEHLTVAWLGHSTILINFFGKWVLTDPVLFERVGVYLFGSSLGPSRITPPALNVEEIPKPDLILLSHAHYDHMDYPTIKHFAELYPGQIDVVVAYLTNDVVEDLEWKSLTILDWNDEVSLPNFRIKAFEVKHFGWRMPWEKDRSRGYIKDGRSFNSYVIEREGKKIFFAGDTAMTDKFISAKNENVDIAIMPVGAYNPWKWNHCNPEEALKMAESINAKYIIPVHTKTFRQSSEPFEEPIDWLKKSVVNYSVKLGLEEIGQTFKLS
ncbi:MAG: MBL fold metallo-hydrolase [bacterium]